MTAPIRLPVAWWLSLDTVAVQWQCHRDQVLYMFDAGLLTPWLLLPKYLLPLEAQSGAAPNVCIVLESYRSLMWTYTDDDARAYISGSFVGFAVEREGFRTIPVQLVDPVEIRRSQLVMLTDQADELEAMAVASKARCKNKAQERADDMLIAALAEAAFPDDVAHPYRIAAKLLVSIECAGLSLSREAIAGKLKHAMAMWCREDELSAAAPKLKAAAA